MGMLGSFFNIIMHIDNYLNLIVQQHGILTYVLLFAIIFLETGLVITPFLPGDSVLFAAGAIAAISSLNIFALLITLYIAAILGDTVNYHIGKRIGNKILEHDDKKFVNKKYLIKAQDFYKKNGSIAIVLGRFTPIIRTFTPFVAGICEMQYNKFIVYNILGGSLWVTLFVVGGYLFGNLHFIKNNFPYILMAIIIISLLPGIIAIAKEKRKSRAER